MRMVEHERISAGETPPSVLGPTLPALDRPSGLEDEVVSAECLGVLPLAPLDDSSIAVRLVIVLPESIDRRVVEDGTALKTIGPDVGPDVLDANHLDGPVLRRRCLRGPVLPAL